MSWGWNKYTSKYMGAWMWQSTIPSTYDTYDSRRHGTCGRMTGVAGGGGAWQRSISFSCAFLSLSDPLRTALCVFIIVLSHLIYHQILSLTQPPFTHPVTFVFSIPISPSRPISLPLPTSGQKFEISQLTQSIRMVGMVKNPREWWSQKRKELEGTRVPPPPPPPPRLPAAFMIPAIVEPLDLKEKQLVEKIEEEKTQQRVEMRRWWVLLCTMKTNDG